MLAPVSSYIKFLSYEKKNAVGKEGERIWALCTAKMAYKPTETKSVLFTSTFGGMSILTIARKFRIGMKSQDKMKELDH